MEDLIRRHLLKIISGLLAVLLWFYVLNSESLVIEKKVALEFLLPPDKAISNEIPREIMVKLKGPRVLLRSIFPEGSRILLDIGRNIADDGVPISAVIRNSDIPLPIGVELLAYQPKQIDLVLQRKISKLVDVRVSTVGQIARDMKIVFEKVTPKRMMVEGPIDIMRKTSKVSTSVVDLSNLKGEGEIDLRIVDMDPRIKIKEQADIKYQYMMKSQKENDSVTLHGIKIRYISSRRKFSSENWVATISVLSSGERLNKSDFQVIADLPEGVAGRQKIRLTALLPEGIHLVKIIPEEIWVDIQ